MMAEARKLQIKVTVRKYNGLSIQIQGPSSSREWHGDSFIGLSGVRGEPFGAVPRAEASATGRWSGHLLENQMLVNAHASVISPELLSPDWEDDSMYCTTFKFHSCWLKN